MARVLLIDDERSIRITLGAFLRGVGHDVTLAENGESGLEAFEKDTFDIVLSDVLMPGCSGVEVLQAIRRANSRVAVVLMTGRPTLHSATAALRAKAFDYLQKPVSKDILLAVVAEAANEKANEDELLRLQEERRSYQKNLERLVAERTGQLERSEASLLEAQRVAHMGSWDRNLQTDTYTWSEETFRMCGRDPADDAPDIDVYCDQVHPDDRERFARAMEESLRTGEYDIEYRLRRLDDNAERVIHVKGEVDFNGEGHPVRRHGVTMDITERKQAEERLRESESRFRKIYEHVKVGIARISLEFRIVEANAAYYEMLGYRDSELAGKYLLDITCPESINENVDLQNQLVRGDIDHFRLEKCFVHRDGHKVYGILDASLVRDAAGEPAYFLGSVIDISERREAQQRLQDIIDHSREIFYIHDSNHRITFITPQCEDLFGYTPQEMMRKWTELTTDNPVNDLGFKLTEKALATGEQQPVYELEMQCKDGNVSRIEVDESPLKNAAGDVIGMVGGIQDITERKRIEAELRVANERFSLATDSAKIGVWDLDLVTGTLVWDERMYRLYGVDEKDFTGTFAAWEERIHPDDLKRVRLEMDQAMTGETAFDTEYRVVLPDGTVRHIKANAIVTRDADGTPVRRIGVNYDITERKEAERRRELLEAQLRQSQKFESIGTLAGGVAHEINNPINGIMNYAQLIMDELHGENEEIDIFAREIILETERVATLVRDLLTFARRDKQGEYKSEDLSQVIESTLTLIRAVMRREQITLEVDMPEEAFPLVSCDGQQIRQVLMNLLTNARDALNEKYDGYHENKTIRVRARCLGEAKNQCIRIAVEDHGDGFSDKVRDHMFDPFFTTKPEGVGTGLGLAISYGIMRDHGGRLWAETELGKWARFHIELPITPTTDAVAE